ncbi:hypothetical protein GCM10008959_25150 [Deinococcus seoulensis]|uniref:Uncharacterized protein n=1 Tax=Deinococcus seoulensis TaxID=1837379 RepID=A0ABQ2RU26_9DEIO|nr:hypothetical protein [Deinococcus seoulensis]GGR62178.1 hypothetical protein GCM10008959_25150 [Deinococcus seoulensis]
MRSQKFAFGTNTRRTLPFTVAGETFFAHPLTADEDLTLADIADRYDLDGLSGATLGPFMAEMAETLARILQTRAQGSTLIPTEWVLTHVGLSTQTPILDLLRTGNRPEQPLELTPWLDEPFSIQDRAFTARPLNFAEHIRLGSLPEDGTSRELTQGSAALIAEYLDARTDETGEPITAAWLTANVTANELGQILSLLQNGPEALDPNADRPGEGSPPSEADASSTS